MSQPEYIEEHEDFEAADSGQTILSTLLVCSGVFLLAGIICVLYVLGDRYDQPPFAPDPIRGDVNQVSDSGHYISFSLPGPDAKEEVQLGDTFYIYRDGTQYVGRAVVERNAGATLDNQPALEQHWGISINSDEYIGRVLEEFTVVDNDGQIDIQPNDKVSARRPANLKGVE